MPTKSVLIQFTTEKEAWETNKPQRQLLTATFIETLSRESDICGFNSLYLCFELFSIQNMCVWSILYYFVVLQG